MKALVHVLFIFFLYCQSASWAALSGLELNTNGTYLSVREKAVIALALKAAVTTSEEKALLVRTMGESLESIPRGSGQSIEVKSFVDFLNFEGDLEFFANHSLADLKVEELLKRLLPRHIFSKDPQVQEQIDGYYLKRREARISLGTYLLVENLDFFTSVDNLDLKHIEDKARQKFSELSAQVMKDFVSTKDSAFVALIGRLLKSYFAALPSSQKFEIMYQVSQLPFPSSMEDVFLTLVKHSGPQLQKLLQIVGRSEDIPENFQRIFQKLENQGAQVPWWKVRKILETDGILKKLSYVSHEPLGVGTMAQTHLAELNGRQVVIRFLKPGIAEMLQMDYEILVRLSAEIDSDPDLKKYKLPSLSKLVGDIHSSVKEELVILNTIRNQNQALAIYTQETLISFDRQKNYYDLAVPAAFLLHPESQVMIQDLVKGKKPAQEFLLYSDLYPNLYKTVAESLSVRWIEEAFFRSGFFHADMHQGNILVNISDEAIRVFLLDFGMVGNLNQKLQESALLLALGARIQSAKLITKHLLSLDKRKRPEVFKSFLYEKVEERLRKIQGMPQKEFTLERWTAWAIDQGLDLNYEFLKLNRGIMAIHSLLENAKSSENLISLAEKAAFRNKARVTKFLLAEPELKARDYLKLGFKWQQLKVESSQVRQPVRCESLFP